jgi:cystine transport system substrate-binding protein
MIVAVGLALALPGAGGADPAQKADALRRQQSALGSRSHAALMSLYSLNSRLTQAHAQLESLRARAADVRVEQARVKRDEQIAQRAWRKSVDALGAHLRSLYEQGEPDAIAILVGATSIDDAVTRLDALARSARLSRQTIAQTRSAQRSLAGLRRTLAARAAELQHLLAQAEQTTAALEQARGRRLAYLAALARERNLNANQIRRLDSAAQQIAARSQTITLEQGTLPAVPEQQSTNGQTLTVSSTGYSLPGHTATGMPVGWGVVAVDPSVIPLGTRMTIPGYGEGVAADVGSAVRGATIDLWFPTLDQARAWGRRTVTITLH